MTDDNAARLRVIANDAERALALFVKKDRGRVRLTSVMAVHKLLQNIVWTARGKP